MKITIPVSLGELYDKLSILEIKIANMNSPEKIVNVINEYKQLREIADKYPIDDKLYVRLKELNEHIWNIEDGTREEERKKSWGQTFIDLARSVYIFNDKRAELKKDINRKYGSEIIEEKSYKDYNRPFANEKNN
jgi:hypothetical protein